MQRHHSSTRAYAVLLSVVLLATGALAGQPLGAAPSPPSAGADAGGLEPAVGLPEAVDLLAGANPARPRIVTHPDDLTELRDRVQRSPYQPVLRQLQNRANNAPAPSEADQADCVQTPNVAREFMKMRAASNLSFLYLLDRIWDPDTQVVRQPSAEERQALGDRARDYLRWMCAESRTKVQVDRDINTSNELLSGLVAYDNLLGAGYDFAEHGDVVLDNLVSTTAEFYSHYNQPNSSNFHILGASRFAVNNHRSKGAATIAIGAMVLHDLAPEVDPVTDPEGWDDPRNWIDFGLERVDLVQRFTYGPGDGTYGEGPHYWRYAAINIVPMARAWDRIAQGATVSTRHGIEIPSLWRHPTFTLMQRWLLDMTLPDGTLAPLDDNKVGERGHFGNIPGDFPDAGAFAWRWENTTAPWEIDAAIDMGPWSIAIHDDSVIAEAPSGSPTRFYVEGGNAIFRSDWGQDARMVIVQGQHGAAREFGRNRDGVGEIWSAAHDHADPGAFLFHAYGERLLMDPGYMDYAWSMHRVMNKPNNHNMVLVGPPDDPQHPIDPLPASITNQAWGNVAEHPVPADGNAQISHTLDSAHLDAARVTARFGPGAADGGGALVQRRFLMVDDTYLVTADRTTSDDERQYTWPVHGNGGGSNGVMPAIPAKSPAERPPVGIGAIADTPYAASGGSFALTDAGAVWERPSARISVGLAFDAGEPAVTHRDEFYEQQRNSLGQYTALYAEVTGADVQGLTINYPTPAGQAPPTIERVEVPDAAALRLSDVDGDRHVFAFARQAGGEPLTLGPELTGVGTLVVDGDVAVLDTDLTGNLRSLSVEEAFELTYDNVTYLRAPQPSTMSIRLGDDQAEIVAPPGVRYLEVEGLGFEPTAIDGACGVVTVGGRSWVERNGERRVVLRSDGEPGRPGADPGDFQRVPVDTVVSLDGTRSCSSTMSPGELSPTWSLVSAPAGSRWTLTGTETWNPQLTVDRPGPFRVRLTVTDADGRASEVSEVLVVGGTTDIDGIDNDLDGLWDAEDVEGEEDLLDLPLPDPASPAGAPSSVDAQGYATVVAASWSEVDDDGGTPVLAYRVDAVDESTGSVLTSAQTEAGTTETSLGGLPYGSLVRIEVHAITAVGAGAVGVAAPVAVGFSDVGIGHPFLDDVIWAADRRATTGYDDGTFRPASPVSRQAMAAFLWRLAGEPEPSPDPGGSGEAPTSSGEYTDVGADHPFATAITWLSSSGITTGHDDGTFRPTSPVSRQAMAAFLNRRQAAGLD